MLNNVAKLLAAVYTLARNAIVSPASAGVASWLQAVAVIIGLAYAAWQLGQLVEQNQIPKRTEYLKRYEEWLDKHRRRISDLETWSYQARIPQVSDADFASEIGNTDLEQSLSEYLNFASKFQACAVAKVCDPELTAELLCSNAKRLYQSINLDSKKAAKQQWTKFSLWFHNDTLVETINFNCGRWDRLKFWSIDFISELLARDMVKPSSDRPTITQAEVHAKPTHEEPGAASSASTAGDIFFARIGSYEVQQVPTGFLAHSWLTDQINSIVIEGHADERGSATANALLGWNRAEAVRRYLVVNGISENRITIMSYGAERPLCKEHTERCWQKNRRAHVRVDKL
jgi:hypothetical protein